MFRTGFLGVFAGLVLASAGQAQTAAWRFQWKTGQVLNYGVKQTTTATEEADGKKTETTAKLLHVKRWLVLDVDSSGNATVQMSLTALRYEFTTPGGEVLQFDSADPEKSSPQLREQMAAYVGTPLAVLRMDPRGRVLEVKQSKHGPASRFESEPPFALILPEEGPTVGQSWERVYQITLDPPRGTGEKYDATQLYSCKAIQDGTTVVTVATVVKSLPEALLDRVPLLQMQPTGVVMFDTAAGRLQSARLSVDKELLNHQGEGSRYQLRSTYVEDYLPPQ